METIKLRDEFIKLGQALKAAGFVESGVDAKYAVQDGLVKVNGQTETQRGKKLHAGDVVEYDGQTVKIMIVKSLKLNQFRNYESLQLSFDKGTNLFYGNNAQGKTNILEAVYLCGTTKSHKGSKDREMIRFGEEEAHIRMAISRSQSAYEIDMHLKKNRPKGIAVNGVPIRKAAELLGIANFVFFSPEDLGIIKNGPAERRRFIDMELCQLDKLYLHELSNYNKVIIQRNKLLKECSFNSQYEEMLDIWDMQLVKYGKKLIE